MSLTPAYLVCHDPLVLVLHGAILAQAPRAENRTKVRGRARPKGRGRGIPAHRPR